MSTKRYRRIDKDEFEDLITEHFDVDDIENEGSDLRIDFPEEVSIWLRDGTSVEGSLQS